MKRVHSLIHGYGAVTVWSRTRDHSCVVDDVDDVTTMDSETLLPKATPAVNRPLLRARVETFLYVTAMFGLICAFQLLAMTVPRSCRITSGAAPSCADGVLCDLEAPRTLLVVAHVEFDYRLGSHETQTRESCVVSNYEGVATHAAAQSHYRNWIGPRPTGSVVSGLLSTRRGDEYRHFAYQESGAATYVDGRSLSLRAFEVDPYRVTARVGSTQTVKHYLTLSVRFEREDATIDARASDFTGESDRFVYAGEAPASFYVTSTAFYAHRPLGERSLQLLVTGANSTRRLGTRYTAVSDSDRCAALNVFTVVTLSPGDAVEFLAWQNSGEALLLGSPRCGIHSASLNRWSAYRLPGATYARRVSKYQIVAHNVDSLIQFDSQDETATHGSLPISYELGRFVLQARGRYLVTMDAAFTQCDWGGSTSTFLRRSLSGVVSNGHRSSNGCPAGRSSRGTSTPFAEVVDADAGDWLEAYAYWVGADGGDGALVSTRVQISGLRDF